MNWIIDSKKKECIFAMAIHLSKTWKIDLDKKTATAINGITFKLTEVEPNTFQWICANPKDIPSDDLDDEILGKMVKEADAIYRWQLKVLKR
jgi:hypothetical protein